MRYVFIALLLMASTATPEEPRATPVRITRAVNPNDYYPPKSVLQGQLGSPVVEVCVGPTGALLRDPLVTDTSGFPELDKAAVKVAKDMQYAAATENGVPLEESCVKFKVKFDLSKR